MLLQMALLKFWVHSGAFMSPLGRNPPRFIPSISSISNAWKPLLDLTRPPHYTDSIRQQWDHNPTHPRIRPRGCENPSKDSLIPAAIFAAVGQTCHPVVGHWLLGRKEGVFEEVDINRGAEESTPSYTGYINRGCVCNLPRNMGTKEEHGFLNPFVQQSRRLESCNFHRSVWIHPNYFPVPINPATDPLFSCPQDRNWGRGLH